VLSKIKPAHAARVLALFANSFALEVVVRMLRMETVQKDVLDHVENTLRTEFMTNLARGPRRDAHEIMAEIFNNFDRTTESRFMTALEERSSEAAERIKKLMFTFEDLIRVDAGGIQALLRKVAKDKLAIALKGATDPLKELFLGNMSERAAKMLREDMDSLGPVRLRDVDEAQAAIVAEAKVMAEAGDIVIAAPDGADELVY
jgi:flagellar motor switch protein FliG